MARFYWHCSVCGGNFDHGEKCDCMKENIKQSKNERLVLGVDFSAIKDTATIVVAVQNNSNLTVVNAVYGKEAIDIYNKLVGVD